MEKTTGMFDASSMAITKDVATSATQPAAPQEKIRTLTKLMYDIQKERIAVGNRIVAYFRLALGLSKSEPDSPEVDPESDSLLQSLLKEYQSLQEDMQSSIATTGITPRVSTLLKRAKSRSYILGETEYALCDTYYNLRNSEALIKSRLEKEVQQHPMWDAFFSQVRGCGPLMSAVCLSYFDPYTARHCSSFWKYAGLDVVMEEDSEGNPKFVGRKAWHTEMREYVDSEGNVKEKKSITYNPFVKTKLIGVLGSGFIKAGGKYRQIYDDYKMRIINRGNPDLTLGHIHAMAIRYAVKMFLRDMWVEWRTIEGLPVTKPYEVEFLGRNPHGFNY